mgnify:CR=1 FL=1
MAQTRMIRRTATLAAATLGVLTLFAVLALATGDHAQARAGKAAAASSL